MYLKRASTGWGSPPPLSTLLWVGQTPSPFSRLHTCLFHTLKSPSKGVIPHACFSKKCEGLFGVGGLYGQPTNKDTLFTYTKGVYQGGYYKRGESINRLMLLFNTIHGNYWVTFENYINSKILHCILKRLNLTVIPYSLPYVICWPRLDFRSTVELGEVWCGGVRWTVHYCITL